MCTQKYINTCYYTAHYTKNVLKTNIRIKMNPKRCVQGNIDNKYTKHYNSSIQTNTRAQIVLNIDAHHKETLRFVVWSVQFECRQQTEYIYSKSISKPMLCVVVAGLLSLMVVHCTTKLQRQGAGIWYVAAAVWCVALLLSRYECGEPYGTRRMYSNRLKNQNKWTLFLKI